MLLDFFKLLHLLPDPHHTHLLYPDPILDQLTYLMSLCLLLYLLNRLRNSMRRKKLRELRLKKKHQIEKRI